MVTTLKQYLLIMVATLSLVLMPTAANAQYVQLNCKNGVAAGQFYYADPVNNQGACQYQGLQHVFSQIVCNFVVVLNSVLGQAYCGIQYFLTPILAALITLYVAVFGVQILMGTAQLNTKEIITRLLKIAGVWALATQSTWGVSYIFQFFLGFMSQASMWVINSFDSSNPITMPVTTTGDFMPMYAYLDSVIYGVITGPFTNANNKLIGFFLVLPFFFPMIFGMAVYWLIETVTMLAHTMVNFLLCLSAIAFLIALSPIFLSFMLFQATANFFEDWLKYLISYSLQVVIVFAIIALWISTVTLFKGFFNDLSDLIFPFQNLQVTGVFNPDNTFGICKFIASYSPPDAPGQACVIGLPCMPMLQCDGPINNNTVSPPSVLLKNAEFIYFMMYNLTALVIAGYTFNVLIKNAPDIARQLSGPAAAPALAAGFGMRGVGQARSSAYSSNPTGKNYNVAPLVTDRDNST